MFAILVSVIVPHMKISKQPFVHIETQNNILNILLIDFGTYFYSIFSIFTVY